MLIRHVEDISWSERYSFSVFGSTSPKRMQFVSTLLALSKAPTVPLCLAGQVSRPCIIQQINMYIGDSFAGYMEGQIIGIEFGLVEAPPKKDERRG